MYLIHQCPKVPFPFALTALSSQVAASLASCGRLALEPRKATRDGTDKLPKAAFRQDHSTASSFEGDYWTSASSASGSPPSPQATTTKPPVVNPTANPPTSGGCQCGVANPMRIVGGTEVQPAHKYPWQIGLKNRGGTSYWCGGAVINDRYILTAAHCFFDSNGNQEPAEDLVVGVGDHLMSSTSDDVAATKTIGVAEVILHPSYDSDDFDNDVALVKLSEVLAFSAEVRPVCLPEDDSKTYAGAAGIASGWGTLSSGGNQPNQLMEVTLPILEPSCWGQTVTDRMLCAGYAEGGKDTCQGDSGGPLCVVEGDRYYEVGVTSHGSGCADANSPGVYSRVSKFLSWIKANTADATYC